MLKEVVVIGAGGFGREALDVLEAVNKAARSDGASQGYHIVGVADDDPRTADVERLTSRNVDYLGTTDDVIQNHEAQGFLIGVGDPIAKAAIDTKFIGAGWTPTTIIHPSATIGSKCALGEGTVICSGAQLSTNTILGRHVHINPNATIGHDVNIQDYVSVNPGAIISGDVVVEREALLGAGSVVLQQLRVGSNSTVGANACVVRDVEAGAIMVGVPARKLYSAEPDVFEEMEASPNERTTT